MTSISVLYGLISAITWGAGDFCGGMAAKRSNPYGVVIFGHGISFFFLVGLAVVIGDPLLQGIAWLWSGLAGICGAIGVASLYRALAGGTMSITAPISALIAAALPVSVGFVRDGFVGGLTLGGFGLALGSVWLISGGAETKFKVSSFSIPILAGTGFGGYFVFLQLASRGSTLWPLVVVRAVSVFILFIFCVMTKQSWRPERQSAGLILWSSILDTAGNAFYILSVRAGRLDVAAVVASLYPGSTVLLAYIILKERMSRWQMVGIVAALIAIVMITAQM